MRSANGTTAVDAQRPVVTGAADVAAGVDQGGAGVLVTDLFLHEPQVITVLDQVCDVEAA